MKSSIFSFCDRIFPPLTKSYIIEQYCLRLLFKLFVNVESIDKVSRLADDLLGVVGLDDVLDGGRAVDVDLLADELVVDLLVAGVEFCLALDLLLTAGLLFGVALPIACFFADELGVFLFLAALDGLAGDLKSLFSDSPIKLNSLIGETDDLLRLADEVAGFLALERFPTGVFVADEVVFFLSDAGVDLGLGVPLMGREDLLAGVADCLAIMNRNY